MKKTIKVLLLLLMFCLTVNAKDNVTTYKDGDMEKIIKVVKEYYKKNDANFNIVGENSTEKKFINLQNQWLKNAKEECRFVYRDIMSGNTAVLLMQACMNSKKKSRYIFLHNYYMNPWKKTQPLWTESP